MLIGYARVSTSDQTLHLQKDALQKTGCDKLFTDTASGAKAERIGLDEALNYVRVGDTLVVVAQMDRTRNLQHTLWLHWSVSGLQRPELVSSSPLVFRRFQAALAFFFVSLAQRTWGIS